MTTAFKGNWQPYQKGSMPTPGSEIIITGHEYGNPDNARWGAVVRVKLDGTLYGDGYEVSSEYITHWAELSFPEEGAAK